ncbi:P-loop containing nucleoside triphosphate hydrolase protein [Dioscorea alata]|uniref:P-loop containing nucleoside triphosphate hydrolase protein n=1 Tax=Dioscorea alata TaxID=55571 RepID=A0ACB7U5U5_DIOAL|nr:P-loop containing nucleoside triphosphate hydrolase protein [Dioscorea alata]
MVSGIASSLAGALFAPVSQYAVDKLVDGVIHHLSKDKPSSSSSSNTENNNQKVLCALVKELQDVSQKMKATLRVGKMLHNQDESVLYFYKQLKDALYEAEDLADDFEYLKLEEQVEKMNNDYEATASTHQSIAKKPRISPTKALELQDDIMISNIREVIGKLNRINDDLSSVISMAKVSKKLGKKDDDNFGVVLQHSNQSPRVTTSSVNVRKICGRDRELEILKKLLTETDAGGDCNVNVIPIVGMGGIGKTTLTQHAFNDEEVAKCFDRKVWICVSDDFNRSKILQDMVSSLTVSKSEKFAYNRNLDLLEGELKRNLQGKTLLLVLDDVWSSEWEKLLIPLQASQMRSAKIVVTTRESKVLRKQDENNKIVLKGLEDDDYWEFFVSCAFGGTEANEHSSLQIIGKHIVKKLKGSPLAAKTVGRLLEQNMCNEHWMDVLRSDLWELGTSANDIMPALALSYNHLPEHLQQCFIFCSVFPKDYEFMAAELIEMWIAEGYVVEPETSSKTVEEMGQAYFDELLSRSFIEKSYFSLYTIHDLLHDLAQSVCLGECVVYNGQTIKDKASVRHLCLLSIVNLRLVCNVESLRTLVLLNCELYQEDYEALKSIRVLILLGSQAQNYSYSIGHLRHLRYLEMSEPSIKLFDESLCKLYHLRVLPDLVVFPKNLHNLVNLRALNSDAYRVYTKSKKNIFTVISLWTKRQYKISQLRNMKELRGLLLINDLEKIENREEAEKANIKEKSHLEVLILGWNDSSTSYSSAAAHEVLEALAPNPKLKHLHISGYNGYTSPSWFLPFTVHNLQILELIDCKSKLYLQSIGQLTFLSRLCLYGVDVRIDISDEVTILFPALEWLDMCYSSVLFEGMSSSLSSRRRHSFPRISYIRYEYCYGDDFGLPWQMFSNVRSLYITCSQRLYEHFSRCLIHLKQLTIHCRAMVSFVGEINTFTALSHLSISSYHELTSIGGLHFMSSLCSLKILHCSKFTSWLSEGMEQGGLLQKLDYIYRKLSKVEISAYLVASPPLSGEIENC